MLICTFFIRESLKNVGIKREFMDISLKSVKEFKLTLDELNGWCLRCELKNEFKRIVNETSLIHLNFNVKEEKLILIGREEQICDAKKMVSSFWELMNKKSGLLISGWIKCEINKMFIPNDIVFLIQVFYPIFIELMNQ